MRIIIYHTEAFANEGENHYQDLKGYITKKSEGFNPHFLLVI